MDSAVKTTSEQNTPPIKPPKKTAKKARSPKKLIITLVVIALVMGAAAIILPRFQPQNPADAMTNAYTFVQAQVRDIVSTLSGSGMLEPTDSYTVSSLVSAEILKADFEDGDIVKEGDVLYEIDSSQLDNTIKTTENSTDNARENYQDALDMRADLTVESDISGIVSGLTVKEGDPVNTAAAIATIEDISTLSITEYYSEAYINDIYMGMQVQVSIPSQMIVLPGTVTGISGATLLEGSGVTSFAVTVSIENPGALTPKMMASSALPGEIYPMETDSDGLEARARSLIYADISGTAVDVLVKNGEYVNAGQLLVELESDTLQDQIDSASDALRDAELNLDSRYDSLDDYIITAPIDGTIVEKNYKEGEKSETGKAMCIIYDLSALVMTLNVDELDISRVKVGQQAVITADAVEGSTYIGEVTRVGVNGTTSGGVTTYPVSIEILETEGLLPGMNVDIEIVTEQKMDVVSIPADAVQRGGMVLVQTEDGTTGEGAPEGYAFKALEIGTSDEDFAEVISGLSEGDQIAYIPPSDTSFDIFDMFESGQMPAGQVPTGGVSVTTTTPIGGGNRPAGGN